MVLYQTSSTGWWSTVTVTQGQFRRLTSWAPGPRLVQHEHCPLRELHGAAADLFTAAVVIAAAVIIIEDAQTSRDPEESWGLRRFDAVSSEAPGSARCVRCLCVGGCAFPSTSRLPAAFRSLDLAALSPG